MKPKSVLLVAASVLSPFTSFLSATEQPDWIPQNIRVPAGHQLLLRAPAVGVQIYDCRAMASRFEWIFRAPEAGLFSGDLQLIGTHFGGPTWQALDGSRVTAMRVDGSDARNPVSIPWLLLKATSHEGDGTFSGVTYIQRLLTAAGTAPPAHSCDASHEGDEARVDYIAVYYFYVEEAASPKNTSQE